MSKKPTTKKTPKPRRKKKRLLTKEQAQSRKRYLAALDKLGLTVASKATAEALGIGRRQCMRFASGEVQIPAPVEKLLGMYLKHGIEHAAP